MKKIIHKTACLFLLTGVVAVMTGCTSVGGNQEMIVFFQEWKTENPEAPEWSSVGDADIDKIGEKVINGLAVAKWKKLNALAGSSTGVEGEQDYWAVQRAIAVKQDEAEKEKDADLDDTEVSDLVATALADFTPEQRANFVKIKTARAEATSAYADWGGGIASDLPAIISAAVSLKEKFEQEGDYLTKIKMVGAVGNILGSIGEISDANKGIEWLQAREELIQQHETNLKSGN